MRIISLCVDGIKQAAKRGFYDWVVNQDADIICIQDIRAWEGQLYDQEKIFFPKEYHGYFFDAADENFSGVAIYCRKPPKAIMTGLGFPTADLEGRYIQADYDEISIGSILAPCATEQTQSQEHKIEFFDDLQAHLNKITRKRREYVICGNWNMAHTKKDVQNWETNQNNSGFLPHERQWMDQLYNQLGYVDAFRHCTLDGDEYTWWPSGTHGEGEGWRVDTQVVSGGFRQRVEYASIYKNQAFSSHAPVIVDYDYEL